MVDYGDEEVEKSLTERFEKRVVKYGGRVAIRALTRSLSYNELNALANRVARAILQNLGESERGVCAFLVEHSEAQEIAVLGILKAGQTFVPLDTGLPPEAMGEILEDSRASVIVTNDENLRLAEGLAGSRREIVNTDRLGVGFSEDNLHLSISPDQPACLYYSSGSTGKPKGAMSNHRTLLHFIKCISDLWEIDIRDQVVHLVPSGFGASVMTMMVPLLNGATLVPHDLKKQGLFGLSDWMIENGVTIYFSVPSVFRHFVRSLRGDEKFKDLRLIVVGGETLYQSDVDAYQRIFPDSCVLHNILASVETWLMATNVIHKENDNHESIVPVGHPAPDKEIILLGDDGRQAEPHAPGTIVVKSRYLFSGYLNRPDLTEKVLRPAPEGGGVQVYSSGDVAQINSEGLLVHLGRKDFDVKIRGQKVNIGEVETALLDVPEVKEAAVVAQRNAINDMYLVAYIVPKSKPGPSAETLRMRLRTRLPDFKVPHFYEELESLPRTLSGKIDRKALPDYKLKRQDSMRPPVAPRNELESTLAGIVEDFLGFSPVGIQDNFFDLGLDSLQYLTMLLEVERKLGRDIPFYLFANTVNIEEMAEVIRRYEEGSQEQTGIEIAKGGRRPPFHQSPRAFLFTVRMVASEFLARIAPYEMGSRFLAKLLGNGFVQNVALRHYSETIRRFVTAVDTGNRDQAVTVSRALCNNLFREWRYAALARLDPRAFDEWIAVEGIADLHDYVSRKGGAILLNSHFGLAILTLLVLERAGFGKVVSLHNDPFLLHELGLEGSGRFSAFPTSRTYEFMYVALQTLKQDGIVHLAADGYRGESGMTLSFHHRKRPFRAGFVELSRRTGAPLVPVFVSLDRDGHVKIQFLKALETGKSETSPDEREKSLIQQYADILAKRWAEEPWGVTIQHMIQFLEMPKA